MYSNWGKLDGERLNADADAAFDVLVNITIPMAADQLETQADGRRWWQASSAAARSFDITKYLHQQVRFFASSTISSLSILHSFGVQGINMRYLGYVRDCVLAL